MYQLPSLPEGFVAQLLFLKERGPSHYEINLVYDGRGRLDRGHSFWLESTPGPGDTAQVRYVSWRHVRDALGRRAPPFKLFSSEGVPIEAIERWLERGEELPPEEPRASSSLDEAQALGPWTYRGLRRLGGAWITVTGYVPSDGDDSVEAARDAAAMLDADAVFLENARHEPLALRRSSGHIVEGLTAGLIGHSAPLV